MIRIVELTAEAERDLEAIGDHIAHDNPSRALTFVNHVRDACLGLALAEHPERFPLVAQFEASGVRHRVVGNHLVFYRVDPARVVILHVLNGAMDYAGLLGD